MASSDVLRFRARVRALDAGLDCTLEEVAPTVWSVPSIRDSTQSHMVIRDHAGTLYCDCKQSQYGAYCAHVAAVELMLERADESRWPRKRTPQRREVALL